MSDFGLYAGIAFQMVDDALDFAASDITGKPCGGDLREGKFTPPVMRYVRELEQADRADFTQKFTSASFSDEEISRIAARIRERGHARSCGRVSAQGGRLPGLVARRAGAEHIA